MVMSKSLEVILSAVWACVRVFFLFRTVEYYNKVHIFRRFTQCSVDIHKEKSGSRESS